MQTLTVHCPDNYSFVFNPFIAFYILQRLRECLITEPNLVQAFEAAPKDYNCCVACKSIRFISFPMTPPPPPQILLPGSLQAKQVVSSTCPCVHGSLSPLRWRRLCSPLKSVDLTRILVDTPDPYFRVCSQSASRVGTQGWERWMDPGSESWAGKRSPAEQTDFGPL